jgi:hypothetical protein
MSQIAHGVKQETTAVPFPFYIISAKTEINYELQDFLQLQAYAKFAHVSCLHRHINSENLHKIEPETGHYMTVHCSGQLTLRIYVKWQ